MAYPFRTNIQHCLNFLRISYLQPLGYGIKPISHSKRWQKFLRWLIVWILMKLWQTSPQWRVTGSPCSLAYLSAGRKVFLHNKETDSNTLCMLVNFGMLSLIMSICKAYFLGIHYKFAFINSNISIIIICFWIQKAWKNSRTLGMLVNKLKGSVAQQLINYLETYHSPTTGLPERSIPTTPRSFISRARSTCHLKA